MTSKRQLAAIMFTDISGFSAMMQSDEVYAKRILSRQRQVIEARHQEFEGKILQYFGDGTLSIFNSAVAAVECAVAIQSDLRRDLYVPLRVGIHSGDITYDANGAFGDGVNVTSRVEKLCIPGAVYLTNKVYDDIKNHPWLTALRLGSFRLHNIQSNIDVYAINAKNLPVPEEDQLLSLPEYETEIVSPISGRKSKMMAAFLALLFGIFGVHRFYLGQRNKGLMFLIAFGISMILAVNSDLPLVGLVAIVGFIDSVLLFAMPRQEFDLKYNQGVSMNGRPRVTKKPQRASSETAPSLQVAFHKGKQCLVKGRFEEAISWFDQVLEIDESHAEAHYCLASCFSLLKDEENAFIHLSLAVKNGFSDFKRIEKDINLYYLRSAPSYAGFAANGYKIMEALPEPKKDILQSDRFDPLILDKIELLGDQLERGELSPQEFQLKKEKILRGE